MKVNLESMNDLFGASKGAQFSNCGNYRYKLWRIWETSLPLAMCVGLNPSKANQDKDDNTISILKRVLKRLEFGGFYMCNLFAWITPNPNELLQCDDPKGGNDEVLETVANDCQEVIFCFGNFDQAEERRNEVISKFPGAKCFGFNQNGTPFHPRALSYKGILDTAQLIEYRTIQTSIR